VERRAEEERRITMAESKKCKLMYVGTETTIVEIYRYVRDEWGEEVILSPPYIDSSGHAGLVLYLDANVIPLFCTSLGIYAASKHDVAFTEKPEDNLNLYDIVPVYVGVVDSDIRHHEF
jgi:hypothetical protein